MKAAWLKNRKISTQLDFFQQKEPRKTFRRVLLLPYLANPHENLATFGKDEEFEGEEISPMWAE